MLALWKAIGIYANDITAEYNALLCMKCVTIMHVYSAIHFFDVTILVVRSCCPVGVSPDGIRSLVLLIAPSMLSCKHKSAPYRVDNIVPSNVLSRKK
jgi:hypothetical protein